MVECKPLAFIFYDRTVIGIAVCRLHIDTHRFPGTERVITDSIAHTVVTFHTVIPVFIVIIGIREIVFSIIFMNPCSFVEVFQTFHFLHFSIQFHHIIFQFAAFTNLAATVIDISLTVIIHKYTRVDQRVHSFDIPLHSKVSSRFFAGSYTDLPTIIPLRITGMREVEIVRTILVSTVGSPHKSTFFASPGHL